MLQVQTPIHHSITDLKPGAHLCCIYSTEEEHRAVITPFLRAGLEKNEKVFYIVDARTRDVVINYLKNDGVDVDYYLNKGQFTILTIADAYMKDGVFDPDRMIALLTSETQKAHDEEYSALRVTGEMSWALRGLPGSERLIEYENKLNTFFPGSRCLAICQYDRRWFDAGILLEILLTHPIAFIGANLYDNFYYTPAEDILKPNHSELTLNRWIKNIIDCTTTEEALREREANIRALIDTPVDSILLVDPEGIILDRNTTFAQRLGMTVEELKGRCVYDLFPPDLVKSRKSQIENIMRTGEPDRYEDQWAGRWFDNSLVPISGADGNITKIAVIALDITDRKHAEEALKKTRQELRFILDSVPALVWQKDTEGRYVQVNKRYCETAGLSEEDVLGRTDHELYPDVIADKYMQDDLEVMASRTDQHGIEEGHTQPFGDSGWSLTDKMVWYDSEGNVKGTIGFAVNITECKRMDDTLREKEEHYRTLAEATHDAIYSMTPDGVMRYVNSSGAAMMGLSPEKIVGLSVENLFSPTSAKEFRKNLDIVVSSKKHLRTDSKFRYLNQDQISWIDTHFVPQFGSDGSVIQVLAISRNITDRKQAELLLKHFNEELESQVRSRTVELERINTLLEDEVIQRTRAEESVLKSLHERELLLREIHHRVKNNLQVIISLIGLQSRNIEDPRLLDTMEDFQNRIMAMAHVHERMCYAEDISRIDLSEIVTFMGTGLFKSYEVDPRHVRLNVEMKDLQITIDTAIPISLIINELISNSIKHAFPTGTPGAITIAGRKEADTIVLTIRDTGIGIPKDLDWMRSKKSLGLRLVVSLVEQLKGTIELDRTTGTVFNIVMKEKQ
jgi:PAS domain S-box-containing protein